MCTQFRTITSSHSLILQCLKVAPMKLVVKCTVPLMASCLSVVPLITTAVFAYVWMVKLVSVSLFLVVVCSVLEPETVNLMVRC